ncbi:LamG-like jellyroll fold domain-containing protein [Saccharicrinis sp. FJH62]|uniref:LamG-like jellyroll fold domain-containing protein n=1 Tax=Saccharicrinis sp. FJH62 TaxID=3344657 RepID=UPI0035D3EA1D
MKNKIYLTAFFMLFCFFITLSAFNEHASPNTVETDPGTLVLKHSYTFEDGTAKDLVGNADGTLVGEKIKIENGKCTVSGAASPTDGYLSFDAKKIALNTYSAITLEIYIETGIDFNAKYTQLAYFGSSTNGYSSLWIQPTMPAPETRISTYNDNALTNYTTVYINGIDLDDGNKHHIVGILSPDSLLYFLDGEFLGSSVTNENFISTLSTELAQLFKGPDVWPDANYNGSIDEFNIYEGNMDRATIRTNAVSYLGNPVKVCYVSANRQMAETASPVDQDPIIRMLKDDPKFMTSVYIIEDNVDIDLSRFDIAIVQESILSGNDILKPGKSLGLATIPIPFIYNKTYAFRDGRALETGGGISSTVSGLSIYVDPNDQFNPLFNGISFSDNSIRIFNSAAADDGSDGTKSFTYTQSLTMSGTNTPLATDGSFTADDSTIFLNDIPSGTTLGDQTTQARMIAFGMNFGTICKDYGTNLTHDGLTLWRNAVYSLAGLQIPVFSVDLKENHCTSPVKIYPTISSGSFNVKFHAGLGMVSIFNLSGEKIQEFVAESDNVQFNINGTPGVYIVKIDSQNRIQTFKVIKTD